MTNYYVDPIIGKDVGNDGSFGMPWATMATAFKRMKGGDTLIAMPGVYAPFIVPKALAGTAAQPTVVQAKEKWRASVRGGDPHGIQIEADADYVTIDGFQAMGAPGDGLKSYGNYAVLKNCWSHHNGSQGIGMHNYDGPVLVNGGTINRCLIEYNGTVPTQEHGIYVSGNSMQISNCIVRHNSGIGMQLYSGAKGPSFSNSTVYNNLIYNHNQHPNSCGMLIRTATNGGNNLILNNTILMARSYALVVDSHADALTGGSTDTIANNILIGGMNFQTNNTVLMSAEALALTWDETDPNVLLKPPASVLTTYNLLFPYDYSAILPDNLLIRGSVDLRKMFIDAEGSVFWLLNNPLTKNYILKRGTEKYYTTTDLKLDFWGQARTVGAPDLGAFPYIDSLAEINANKDSIPRLDWFGKRFPYRFNDTREYHMPDLWIAPPAAPGLIRNLYPR